MSTLEKVANTLRLWNLGFMSEEECNDELLCIMYSDLLDQEF